MLNFHKPSIDDYGWIHDILYPANLPGADNTFHNMYFWECYYGEVAEVCGHVTQRLSQDGVSTYLYPAGNGDVRPALEEIMQDAKQRGEKFCLRGVTDDRKTLLESLYPGRAHRASRKEAAGQAQPLQPLRAGPPRRKDRDYHAGKSCPLPRDGEKVVRGTRMERADRAGEDGDFKSVRPF